MNLSPRAASLAAACAIAAMPARAALWMAEPSVELSCSANDNYGLAFDRRNRVGTMSLTGGVVASRKTESASTGLTASVAGLGLRGDLHQNEWQDSLSLDHTITGELDTFSLGAKTARDDTRLVPVDSTDLLAARGVQRSNEASSGWTHALTERLSTVGSLGYLRTRYGSAQQGAHDYGNASASGSLRWLADERSSINVSASHQDYRTLAGNVRAQTDSLSLGGSRAFSEVTSGVLSLGAYRTRTTVRQAVLVCGTACQVGTGNPQVLVQTGRYARWGLQYNASFDTQSDERTRWSAAASRQQDPSGAGVTVLGDSLRLGAERRFTETTTGAMSWTHSAASSLGQASGPRSRQEALSLLMSRSMTPQLSLRLNADWKRSGQSPDDLHARGASVAITLRYEWQRLESHR